MFRLSFVFLLLTSSLFSSVDWDVLSEEIDEARRSMQVPVPGVCVGVVAQLLKKLRQSILAIPR